MSLKKDNGIEIDNKQSVALFEYLVVSNLRWSAAPTKLYRKVCIFNVNYIYIYIYILDSNL